MAIGGLLLFFKRLKKAAIHPLNKALQASIG